MPIPTEPIGSIPRPPALIEAVSTQDCTDPALEHLYDEGTRDMAFEKIRARVQGTSLASKILGG
jgi:5-methyltetrahydropteroyltriglutamate--homocysteine methyltransferase